MLPIDGVHQAIHRLEECTSIFACCLCQNSVAESLCEQIWFVLQLGLVNLVFCLVLLPIVIAKRAERQQNVALCAPAH